MKILLYETANRLMLSEIAQKINPAVEVLGYVDGQRSDHARYFSGMPLYSILDVFENKVEFDYIFLGERQESELFKQRLLLGGVNGEKIIEWKKFKDFLYENNSLFFNESKVNYNGLIFGMSYSYWGLFTHKLKLPFFKFSEPSLDMFYINKQLKNAIHRETDVVNGRSDSIQYIVFDFPYYIFNYDLSLCKTPMRRQMIIADFFNDFHHFGNTDEELQMIEEFKVWKYMFYESLKPKKFIYNDFVAKHGQITEEMIDELKNNISHVWAVKREKTIQENIELFEEIVRIINDFNAKIKIIICVIPQSMYLEKYHQECITEKEAFFISTVSRVLNKYSNPFYVWDYFREFYDNDELFRDCIHLNAGGGKAFSEIFSKRLEEI